MHLVTAVAVAITATAGVGPVSAQSGPLRLLDVPYLPQTVALCGGAAAAMVMRYWGATGIYAENFAGLVIPEEGGIRGADLLDDLRARGWDARSFRGDAALVQRQLAEGRPLVALIEDRPGVFHYVVIVGWSNGRVIAHDPARAPFRVLDEDAFTASWSRSSFWSLLALPPAADPLPAAVDARSPGSRTARSACDAMTDEGVRVAVGGDAAAGRRIFEAALEACPTSSAPWRELAGLHVLQEEWQAAARDARRAVHLDPADQHAWRILATSLFLDGDPDGALSAWNAIGEPQIDLVNVRGLTRTRFVTALGVTGLEPQAVLRPAALTLARRRLAEMPSVHLSRVAYRPTEGGRAVVEAVVIERPLLPTAAPTLAATGLRTLTDRELRVEIASPTGGGEAWRAAWRWWEHRPAIRVDFRAPGRSGRVRGVTLFSEKESFGASDGRMAERRAGGAVSFADWTSRGTRWEATAGLERWNPGSQAVVLSADLQQRLDEDRARLSVRSTVRLGDVRTLSVGTDVDWRTRAVHEGRVLLARGGLEIVGSGSPMSTWPGAGTGQAREPLLRAHPLLEGGVITGGVFGRTLTHAGAEWRQWHHGGRRVVRFGPAVFVDAARALRTAPPFDGRLQIDAGAGLRIALPGASVLRLDVARGLRDGVTAWSVGWVR